MYLGKISAEILSKELEINESDIDIGMVSFVGIGEGSVFIVYISNYTISLDKVNKIAKLFDMKHEAITIGGDLGKVEIYLSLALEDH